MNDKVLHFQRLIVTWPKSWEKQYMVKIVTDKGDRGFRSELFNNFIEAKSKYSELDPINGSANFSFAVEGGRYKNLYDAENNDKEILEFEEWPIYKALNSK